MGQALQAIKKKLNSPKLKKVELFMLGNSAVGRTTMLYKWKLGEIVTVVPTVGFNVEDIPYKNVIFNIIEAGGGDRIRPQFVHYMPNKHGIIVVVDSSDLHDPYLLQTTLKSCLKVIYKGKKLPLLILANKKDKCKHTNQEILDYVGINAIPYQVEPHIIYTNCFSGEGLVEALEWLYQTYTQ